MKFFIRLLAEVFEFFDYFVHLEGQRNSEKYEPYNFGWLRRKWKV
jgi:hypothetical protein